MVTAGTMMMGVRDWWSEEIDIVGSVDIKELFTVPLLVGLGTSAGFLAACSRYMYINHSCIQHA